MSNARLKIYGNPLSRTDRVLWAANELGLDYDLVPKGGGHGDTRSPEMLALNPNGHIPVIDDGGFVLYESMAINLYLVRKHGGPLAPANPEEDAKALQWTLWALTETESPIVRSARNIGALPGDPVNPEVVQAEFAKLAAPLKVLDAHLADKPYILGDRFTIADLNVVAVLSWAPVIGFDFSPYPRVGDWIRRCVARPAFPKRNLPEGMRKPPQAAA
jgi:glutathione S-transferase